jgi:hypothetical protein
MPHCQLCDFCETTGTESQYYTDFGYSNNKVKYYKDLGGDFCLECVNSIKMNMNTYEDEQEEKQKEEQFDFREHLRERDEPDKPGDQDTPALSEV